MLVIGRAETWRQIRRGSEGGNPDRLLQRKWSAEIGVAAAAIGLVVIVPVLAIVGKRPASAIIGGVFFAVGGLLCVLVRVRLGR